MDKSEVLIIMDDAIKHICFNFKGDKQDRKNEFLINFRFQCDFLIYFFPHQGLYSYAKTVLKGVFVFKLLT